MKMSRATCRAFTLWLVCSFVALVAFDAVVLDIGSVWRIAFMALGGSAGAVVVSRLKQ